MNSDTIVVYTSDHGDCLGASGAGRDRCVHACTSTKF